MHSIRCCRLGARSSSAVVRRRRKPMTKYPLIFLVALTSLPSTVVGQVPLDSVHYPPRAVYHHSVAIVAPYDPDQGKTILQTEPFALDTTLSVSVLTALDGKVVTTPAPNAVFTFWSTAPPGRYAADSRVRAILNGRDTVELGKAWLTPRPRPGYNEVMLQGAFRAQLLTIVNAESVTLIVGPTTVRLTDTQLAVLRDFASRMAPITHQ